MCGSISASLPQPKKRLLRLPRHLRPRLRHPLCHLLRQPSPDYQRQGSRSSLLDPARGLSRRLGHVPLCREEGFPLLWRGRPRRDFLRELSPGQANQPSPLLRAPTKSGPASQRPRCKRASLSWASHWCRVEPHQVCGREHGFLYAPEPASAGRVGKRPCSMPLHRQRRQQFRPDALCPVAFRREKIWAQLGNPDADLSRGRRLPANPSMSARSRRRARGAGPSLKSDLRKANGSCIPFARG